MGRKVYRAHPTSTGTQLSLHRLKLGKQFERWQALEQLEYSLFQIGSNQQGSRLVSNSSKP
jgi:hypothetical protein